MRFDLVLLSLGGVQRFIGEARSTADVAGASKIVQELARLAAGVVQRRLAGSPAPGGLIFPAIADASSVTNKIVFLAPEGDGPEIARAAVEDVVECWQDRLKVAFKSSQPPPTPGTPDLAWVSVTGAATDGDYGVLWEAAQREMVGRRRARVFEPVEIPQSKLCAQSPGLPAVAAPPHSPSHERDEALSAAGWAKRRADSERFPSTVSIASSVFRSRLLERAGADPDVAAELRGPVRELTAAVDRLKLHSDRAVLRSTFSPTDLEPLAGRLGAWVTAERWDVVGLAREYGAPPDEGAVRDGRRAAGALAAVARKAGILLPSPYFAVVVQDLDHLGRALGRLDLQRQREVSHQLSELATRQAELLEDQHPRAQLVYAGGDDLLAFCPAAAALPLAAAIREQVRTAASTGPLATAGPGGTPITASTGVVFAHMSSPLQDALRSARTAIGDAKSATSAGGRSRDALGVVVRRRGGQRARTVQPWWPRAAGGTSAAELLTRIRPGPGVDVLSAVLGSELERDEAMLRELADDRKLLRAELIRLVTRHGGTPEAGEALCALGLSERAVRGGRFAPAPAALVARFLSQETR
ncbi:MAG: Cas10/Cmr2 second palm domain-containing protein [Pseudonocardiaceae bacterium]